MADRLYGMAFGCCTFQDCDPDWPVFRTAAERAAFAAKAIEMGVDPDGEMHEYANDTEGKHGPHFDADPDAEVWLREWKDARGG